MNISRFDIPMPPAVQLGTQSYRALLLPVCLLLWQDAFPHADRQMKGKFSTCLTPVTQEILVFNIFDLQHYKVKQRQQNNFGEEFSPGLHSTVDSIILWKFPNFVLSIAEDGMEQSEMPFSLYLHVPALYKTPQELYFHKVKWRNRANECYCCECRLILLCKQILILNCFLQLDPFWWKKKERGGNKKIVKSAPQSDFFYWILFSLPKIKPIPYSDVLMKIALDGQQASIIPQGSSGNRK